MKHFFQDNKTFIISSLTGILVLSYFLMFYSKTELHIHPISIFSSNTLPIWAMLWSPIYWW